MYWFVCLVCTSPKAINKSIENQHEKQTENKCILIKKTRNIPPDIIKKTPKNCPKYVPKPLKMRSRGGSRSRTGKSAQKCVDLWWPLAPFGEPFGLENPSKKHEKNVWVFKAVPGATFMVFFVHFTSILDALRHPKVVSGSDMPLLVKTSKNTIGVIKIEGSSLSKTSPKMRKSDSENL